MGVNSPILRPILEGPPAHNPYCWRTDLDDTGIWPRPATTQPPDPTLPSRAHHKDYVSRTTSSNYYYYYYYYYDYDYYYYYYHYF